MLEKVQGIDVAVRGVIAIAMGATPAMLMSIIWEMIIPEASSLLHPTPLDGSPFKYAFIGFYLGFIVLLLRYALVRVGWWWPRLDHVFWWMLIAVSGMGTAAFGNVMIGIGSIGLLPAMFYYYDIVYLKNRK